MASEVRVNQIQNRSGLSTVTFSDSGVLIAGVTTVGILSATGNSVFFGNVTASGVVTATSFYGDGSNLTGLTKILTIGVRTGTAVTFSLTGSSFNVSGRSGNILISI